MSSDKFDSLIAEFPAEQDAVSRLGEHLRELCAESRTPELPARRAFDIAKPSSSRILAKILARFVDYGFLKAAYRVQSDSLGGIDDFPSLQEVPDVLVDWRAGDRLINVRMDQIELIYKVNPHLAVLDEFCR